MRSGLSLAALVLFSGCATVKLTGTPLEKAIAAGDAKQAETLLGGGADPNRRDMLTRISPACRAIRARRVDILKILIAHGANIVRESDALYCAVDSGQLDTVKYLLGQGAPIGEYATLRAQDHQPEILAYLKEVQDQRKALGHAAPPAPAPSTTPAPAPAVSVDTIAAVAPQAPAAPEEEIRVPFSVPARPLDVAVVVAVGADAERQARVAAAHLVAQGYPADRVLKLVGPEATRAGIVKTVEGILPQVVKDGATVFFYYCGRGAESGGKDYLMPYDGDPAFLEQTAYPVAQLIEKLGAARARLTVVALDAAVSFSETAPPDLYAVAAAPNMRPGAFSRLFWEGLDGAAKGPNDVVTLGSIGDFIAARSAAPAALPDRRRLAEVVLH